MRAPKLEIKKDTKGMVSVPGATMIEVTSAKELLATIEKGQQRRHVSSTQVLISPPPPFPFIALEAAAFDLFPLPNDK